MSKQSEAVRDLFGGESVKEIESDSTILEVGQGIKGFFRGIVQRKDAEEQVRDIAILEDVDGDEIAIPCGSSLQRKLKHISPGEEIGIIRIDDGQSNSGRDFKNFKVYRKVMKTKED